MMKKIDHLLFERLERKGISPNSAPLLIRDISTAMADNPELTLEELNRRLHLLGWHDAKVDEHTIQLVFATG